MKNMHIHITAGDMVDKTPSYIRFRGVLESRCDDLKIKGELKEFITKFFTVLMYIVYKKELPEVGEIAVSLVSIHHASKLMGKKIDMDDLIKKFNIIMPKTLLEFNQIYEDIIDFQSVEEVEKEYKKIMDEYDEEKRGLHKRDKAVG